MKKAQAKRRLVAEEEDRSAWDQLEEVRAELIDLMNQHPRVRSALQRAPAQFEKLCGRFEAEEARASKKVRSVVLTTLQKGQLGVPGITARTATTWFRMEWPLPVEVASLVRRSPDGKGLSSSDRELCAKALLEAFRGYQRFQFGTLSDRELARMAQTNQQRCEAGTHSRTLWRIAVPGKPRTFPGPNVNAWLSSDISDLKREDRLAFALTVLGGLADLGSIDPLIERPSPTGDPAADLLAFTRWQSRFPASFEAWHRDPATPPDPSFLAPELAAKMLAMLKRKLVPRSARGQVAEPVKKRRIEWTPFQCKLLEALKGKYLDGKQLAALTIKGKNSEQSVRNGIAAIRKLMPGLIEHRAGFGYYRTDAPPPGDEFQVRKIYPRPNRAHTRSVSSTTRG